MSDAQFWQEEVNRLERQLAAARDRLASARVGQETPLQRIARAILLEAQLQRWNSERTELCRPVELAVQAYQRHMAVLGALAYHEPEQVVRYLGRQPTLHERETMQRLARDHAWLAQRFGPR